MEEQGRQGGLRTFLKAVAVMLLAAFGAGIFYGGMHSTFDAGFNIGLGVFLMLGAAFLYRSWFWRKL